MIFKISKKAKTYYRAAATGCVLMTTLLCQAQTLEQAKTMIQKRDYVNAKIAFDFLINKNKDKPEVNKWYGEALYHTGDYVTAEKYLKYAADKKVRGGIRYLALTQRKLYKFNEAIENFKLYKSFLKDAKDQSEIADINEEIRNCEMCLSALQKIETVQIIDSIIVDKDRFFEQYKLSSDCGRLMGYAAVDPKVSASGIPVFESQRKDKQYFAKKHNSVWNIATRTKLSDDTWSDITEVSSVINSNNSNENFPFVLTDGMTMYYASDRQPSFGGYDIFVTQYNASKGAYLAPEKLGMPFNSPFNDYMMAVDETNKVGWFASDRYQPTDKVIIYLFVYNEVAKNFYKGKTEEQLRSLARINSIRDTWDKDDTYDKILKKVYNQQTTVKKQEEAPFIIDDNIMYKTASDFRNDEARENFEKSRIATKALAKNREDLGKLRETWLTTDPYGREEVKNRITALEERIKELEYNIPIFETKARNLELEQLNKKKR